MDARTSKRQKRISGKQEKRMAKDLGGRIQPASGAMPNAKSDVRVVGVVRGEAKYTSKTSYSLKRDELRKIIEEAGLERAVLQLCFIGRSNKPELELAIYPVAPVSANPYPYAEWETYGKSLTISRDRYAIRLLSTKKLWVVFAYPDPPEHQYHWFEICHWADYVAAMEAKDA